MSWNYRVVRFKNEDIDEYFEIKEVFYDKEGKPAGYAEASVFSDTWVGLFDVIELMKGATSKAVLDESEFFTKDKS